MLSSDNRVGDGGVGHNTQGRGVEVSNRKVIRPDTAMVVMTVLAMVKALYGSDIEPKSFSYSKVHWSELPDTLT